MGPPYVTHVPVEAKIQLRVYT